MRLDGRAFDELRPVKITRHYIKHAPGSVLVEMGDTRVLCAATLDERPPLHTRGTGRDGSAPSMPCCQGQRSRGRHAIVAARSEGARRRSSASSVAL